ncbi:glyoxylate/hydroxypyruvate reductase A [Aquabacter sp. CN5-332]|uniref:2-hydroxyacid dehydrogenase n=1 Tax=Aquabacter sp. CN5-332 TaxID=3156608 RepID=UPI0032B53A47
MGDVLLFHSGQDSAHVWVDALKAQMPDLEIRITPDIGDPADIRYALVWRPPADFFGQFPNLALIANLGAGVDGLLARTDLPAGIPITRVSDPDMSRMMASFVLFAVLRHARDIPTFERAQREGRWHYVPPRTADEISVGILGLGQLGATAARELLRQGFKVKGWSRSPKDIEGVECAAGLDALPTFLGGCEILVVMLPLTGETRHLLDAARLACLPKGAKLINVARGPIVDEPALVAALQAGHIAEATLDVFEKEPLPAESPLWKMDNVLITPHLASVAIPKSAAAQIADNIRRVRAGEPVEHRVDPSRGY